MKITLYFHITLFMLFLLKLLDGTEKYVEIILIILIY